MPKNRIDVSLLRSLISYDARTGDLTWKSRSDAMFSDAGHSASHTAARWNTRYAGSPALNNQSDTGYLRGAIFDKQYKAHQVCWALAHGAWPSGDIDHIDGDRTNNRASNLRAVGRSENMKNRAMSSNNTSGHMGVGYCKLRKKWKSRIYYEGRCINLGSFENKEAAVESRILAEKKYGYHQNHGRPL